jgi:hypothetical protein
MGIWISSRRRAARAKELQQSVYPVQACLSDGTRCDIRGLSGPRQIGRGNSGCACGEARHRGAAGIEDLVGIESAGAFLRRPMLAGIFWHRTGRGSGSGTYPGRNADEMRVLALNQEGSLHWN